MRTPRTPVYLVPLTSLRESVIASAFWGLFIMLLRSPQRLIPSQCEHAGFKSRTVWEELKKTKYKTKYLTFLLISAALLWSPVLLTGASHKMAGRVF